MIANSERAHLFALAREMMAQGKNIIHGLTQDEGAPRTVAIEIAYALQSGSYTEYASTETAGLSRREGHAILEPLLREYGCHTLLDCGAGEGTRWLDFAAPLERLTLLDGSWSRLAFAPAIMKQVPSIGAHTLIKGNMMDLPFAPGSFDAVFTSHALEPNTDENAAQIIGNLFAMARKLVVLFEPNYRDAHSEMRARMEIHGYARNIWEVTKAQPGFTTIASGDFEVSPNVDNRTSYLVLCRDAPLPNTGTNMRAPASGTPLYETPDGYRCVDGSFAYPKLENIACLAEEDGVFLGSAVQAP